MDRGDLLRSHSATRLVEGELDLTVLDLESDASRSSSGRTSFMVTLELSPRLRVRVSASRSRRRAGFAPHGGVRFGSALKHGAIARCQTNAVAVRSVGADRLGYRPIRDVGAG